MIVTWNFFICVTFVITMANGWSVNLRKNHEHYRTSNNESMPKLTVGLIVPHTSFGAREYNRSISKAVTSLFKNRSGQTRRYDFLKKYGFSPHEVRTVMMRLTPSPTGINFLFNDKNYIFFNINLILLKYRNCFKKTQ